MEQTDSDVGRPLDYEEFTKEMRCVVVSLSLHLPDGIVCVACSRELLLKEGM
jgi:hypothetical protein